MSKTQLAKWAWSLSGVGLFVGAAATFGMGCSSSSSTTPAHTFPGFHNSGLGVQVEEDADPAVEKTLENGDLEIDDTLRVTLDGVGEHDVEMVEDLVPLAKGGAQRLTVTDKSTGQQRSFSFDPMSNTLTFADGTVNLAVVQNPDKSYTVDGTSAANGKAALALLKKSPVYSDASAWSFVMTYTTCQSCLELASSRTAVDCQRLDNRFDEAPAVCDIFRDFCDCVACDKAGKAPCALCP